MNKALDPKVLIAIKDLSLAARRTVDGFQTGLHKSRVKGSGMEFSQYRSYQPGDDLRSLDWKLFARSDRYYVRESEVETSINVKLMVDNSNSMNHVDIDYSKLEYAKYLAASLAYIAYQQGDAVGLYRFEDRGLNTLSSRRGPLHLQRIIHELQTMKASGGFTSPDQYRPYLLRDNRKSLVIFITDFYQQDEEIIKMLELIASLHHEVLVLHLVANNELKLDFEGYTALEDLETGKVISIDPGAVRKQYQQYFDAYMSRISSRLLHASIDYTMVNISEPVEAVLLRFLKQRQKNYR